MSPSSPSRQPPGIPVGGQFAQKVSSETELNLEEPETAAKASGAPPLKEQPRGVFEVMDTAAEKLTQNSTSVSFDGVPHRRAQAEMVGLRAERSNQLHAIGNKVRSLDGKRATVMIQEANGSVQVVEGTVECFPSGAAIAWPKGTGANGRWLYGLTGTKVLAVEPGYGKALVLAAEFGDHASRCPRLEPANFDGIPEDEGGEPPSKVAAAFVISHPGFDGSQDGRGTVFLATDRDSQNQIVNGYMVCPAGSGLTSEHGSMYEKDLARWGGRAADYRSGSLNFSDAIKLGRAAEHGDDIEMCWAAISGPGR